MWDGFEGFVRAVAGQFVSLAAATTFVSRIVSRYGRGFPDPSEDGPHLLFPGPEELADADFYRIGLTRSRAETIRTGARALLGRKVSLSREQSLGELVGSWTELRGIGRSAGGLTGRMRRCTCGTRRLQVVEGWRVGKLFGQRPVCASRRNASGCSTLVPSRRHPLRPQQCQPAERPHQKRYSHTLPALPGSGRGCRSSFPSVRILLPVA